MPSAICWSQPFAALFVASSICGCGLSAAEEKRANELVQLIRVQKADPPPSCKELGYIEEAQLPPIYEDLYKKVRLKADQLHANYVRLDFMGRRGDLTGMNGVAFSCPEAVRGDSESGGK